MEVTLALWAVTIAGIIGLIVLDFVTVSHKPHEVKFKEALAWSIFYIGIAIAFGVAMFVWQGSDIGSQYFAAYLVEKSLSVDNLFVFIIILTQFAVPIQLHQRVLLFGVVLALILRAIFIAIGAAALSAFAFTFVLFGALLIWTGIQLARHRNEDPEPQDNAVVRVVRKRFAFTDEYHGTKSFVRIDGKRFATPLLLVMIAIGSTDLLFALDSIPAIYGLTREPYIVLVANLFALMGLRQLYFLLGGLLQKLVYLSIGLSVLLAFIGVKLLLHALHENELPFINGGEHVNVPEIPIAVSLGAIVVILGVTTIASLWKSKRDAKAMVAGSDSTTD